jgi:hypothetical protein
MYMGFQPSRYAATLANVSPTNCAVSAASAGDSLSCPISVRNTGNVPLHDVVVESPWLAETCTISNLEPDVASEQCGASVFLTAADFVRSVIYISGNASAADTPTVAFNTTVSLAVMRSVAVAVHPVFKLPSELHHSTWQCC